MNRRAPLLVSTSPFAAGRLFSEEKLLSKYQAWFEDGSPIITETEKHPGGNARSHLLIPRLEDPHGRRAQCGPPEQRLIG